MLGGSAMENIDHDSSATHLKQMEFAEVVDLVCEVGDVVIAPLVVMVLLRMYVYKMRALGVFVSGTKEAATVTPVTADGNGNDDGKDGENDKSNDTNNDDNDKDEGEAVVNALMVGVRLLVLHKSVTCFVLLAQNAFTSATGDELFLPDYMFVVALFTAFFACELFPPLGPWPKLLVKSFCLVFQCLLALLRAIVVRVQRMLRLASCVVARTFRNMLCAAWNMIWNVGNVMWTKLATAGAIVCTPLWATGKAISATLWTALCTAGTGIVDAARLLKTKISQRWEAAGSDDFHHEEPTVAPVPMEEPPVSIVTIPVHQMAPRRRPFPVYMKAQDAERLARRIRGRSDRGERLRDAGSRNPQSVPKAPFQIEEPPVEMVAIPVRQMAPRCPFPVYTIAQDAERMARRTRGRSDRGERLRDLGSPNPHSVPKAPFLLRQGGEATDRVAGDDWDSEMKVPDNAETICLEKSKELEKPKQAKEAVVTVPDRPEKTKKRVRIDEAENRVHALHGDRPVIEAVFPANDVTEEASERAVSETSQITLPEPSRAFERRKLELWRKLQRLVSENSTSASPSSFFPNGRPRTRPAPRRYPTSADEGALKRGIKRGVVDPIPWYRWMGVPEPACAQEVVARSLQDSTTNSYYSHAAQRPTKNTKPMDTDQALRSMLTEFANRPLVLQGNEVHCCTIEPRHKRELWLQTQYFDDSESQEAVPDMLTYLPVTLLRPSFSENSMAEGRKWYVQPGGQGEREKWLEGDRIIWEVPQELLFDKVRAAPGEICDTCHREGQPCTWAPDELERFCDHCADAPRRHLNGCGRARDFGFKWVTACDCLGL